MMTRRRDEGRRGDTSRSAGNVPNAIATTHHQTHPLAAIIGRGNVAKGDMTVGVGARDDTRMNMMVDDEAVLVPRTAVTEEIGDRQVLHLIDTIRSAVTGMIVLIL